MTSAQLEPSAHAPCTSTTLRASTGAAGWACASNPPSVPVSAPATNVATTRKFIIDLAPALKFSAPKLTPACLYFAPDRARVTLDHDVVSQPTSQPTLIPSVVSRTKATDGLLRLVPTVSALIGSLQ